MKDRVKNVLNASLSLSACALLSIAFCPGAHADNASIQSFFYAAAGHYTGSGNARDFSAAGEKDINYDIDLNVALGDDGALNLSSQTDTDGLSGSGQESLHLSGDALYVTMLGGSSIPVRILESTGATLAFSFQYVGYDGQIYTVEDHYCLSSGSFAAHDTISVNGSVVQDDEFQASPGR